MAQTVAFFTGFETGGAGDISLGAGASIVTSPVRTGGYALKNAATGSGITVASATQWVVRTYLQFPALPGATTSFILDRISGAASRLVVGLNAAGTLNASDAGATLGLASTNGTAVLAVNTWYRIEVAFDGAAGGVVQVWVDGTLDINVTHTSNVTAAPTTTFRLAGAATTNEYFHDDVRIDIGGVAAVGAGQTIARQGIAGTPTYNAWTKTGLATAALCWSETPFSATNNCNSSTSAAAQTMIVGTFSGAGSASEGAQTVGASDTINACKVSLIAKRATSGNPSIRRRVNGTDTDTSKAVGTFDTYFDDGIWTTTAANLDLLEAGMVKAADANLTTVEDVWVMVDYTPAAAAAAVPWAPMIAAAITLLAPASTARAVIPWQDQPFFPQAWSSSATTPPLRVTKLGYTAPLFPEENFFPRPWSAFATTPPLPITRLRYDAPLFPQENFFALAWQASIVTPPLRTTTLGYTAPLLPQENFYPRGWNASARVDLSRLSVRDDYTAPLLPQETFYARSWQAPASTAVSRLKTSLGYVAPLLPQEGFLPRAWYVSTGTPPLPTTKFLVELLFAPDRVLEPPLPPGDWRPNISMRSGFRVSPENLVREWTGLLVERRELDPRHPQEFVKGRVDRQSVPNPKPEATDVFLTPNQVKASDL